MSNFKNTQSIFHALVLTAGFTATSAVALTAAAQDTVLGNDAFTLADSNGDNGLDRNEFPVFISLKSGNSSVVSLVSDSTSYEIPFTNKDKNEDGLLDTKELKLVERDVPAWDAPQATETETVDEAPAMEAPAQEAPAEQAPAVVAPEMVEPEIEEPPLEQPVIDDLTIVPLDEGTADGTEIDPLPEDAEGLEMPETPETIEPQPEG